MPYKLILTVQECLNPGLKHSSAFFYKMVSTYEMVDTYGHYCEKCASKLVETNALPLLVTLMHNHLADSEVQRNATRAVWSVNPHSRSIHDLPETQPWFKR